MSDHDNIEEPGNSPQIETIESKDKALEAVVAHSHMLQHVSPKLQKDKFVVLEAIKKDPYNLCAASIELQNDKEIVLTAVSLNGNVLPVSTCGFSIFEASEELQQDEEIILCAIKEDLSLFSSLTSSQMSKEVIQFCLNGNTSLLKYVPLKFYEDADIIKFLIKTEPRLIQKSKVALKNPELVSIAVEYDGLLLNYAHETVQNNFDVALIAVKNNGYALEFYAVSFASERAQMILEELLENGELSESSPQPNYYSDDEFI
eukprot:gene4576-7960_t